MRAAMPEYHAWILHTDSGNKTTVEHSRELHDQGRLVRRTWTTVEIKWATSLIHAAIHQKLFWCWSLLHTNFCQKWPNREHWKTSVPRGHVEAINPTSCKPLLLMQGQTCLTGPSALHRNRRANVHRWYYKCLIPWRVKRHKIVWQTMAKWHNWTLMVGCWKSQLSFLICYHRTVKHVNMLSNSSLIT